MKKLLTLILLCALTLPVFGCGGSGSGQSGAQSTIDDARSKHYDKEDEPAPAEEGTEGAGQQ